MIDIKYIRENADKVKTAVVNKNEHDRVDEILQLDKQRRNLIQQAEELKAKKNKVSQEVGKLKREKKDAEDLITEMKQVADDIKELDDKLKDIEDELKSIMLTVPNLPHESVPVGKSESDNVEVRKWLPDGFSLDEEVEALDHVELGKKLDILDFERGAKITGSSFPLYKGKGATLERALINFMIDFHIEKHGYTEVLPPFFANRESMQGTGQLPKMEDDMYHITREDLFPIPTAEVPVTNIYRDDMLKEDDLPVKFCAYSPCFRREAGSYGKETKGFLRVHQFNKVEMVKFVKPGTSYDELELLLNDAEEILRELGIPYRVLELCTGDLSFAAAKCYDIETWSPAEKKWLEASSCSNFENFQAKRANIRYRKKEDNKPEYLHTLNGSGLATSRLMVSLLEHYQTPEGKITVPKALHKYTGFTTIG